MLLAVSPVVQTLPRAPKYSESGCPRSSTSSESTSGRRSAAPAVITLAPTGYDKKQARRPASTPCTDRVAELFSMPDGRQLPRQALAQPVLAEDRFFVDAPEICSRAGKLQRRARASGRRARSLFGSPAHAKFRYCGSSFSSCRAACPGTHQFRLRPACAKRLLPKR